MTGEEDTKHVIYLTLVPIGTAKQAGDARDGSSLVGVCLDSDSRVVANRKKVVDNFESVVPSREVGGCDSANLCELGSGVIFK